MASEALTTNSSILTAVGNDYGFEEIFVRQIEANGKMGDMLVGITTSGGSKNVIRALRAAHRRGLKTAAFVGVNRREVDGLCDIGISVPFSNRAGVQEEHIAVGHIVCEVVGRGISG